MVIARAWYEDVDPKKCLRLAAKRVLLRAKVLHVGTRNRDAYPFESLELYRFWLRLLVSSKSKCDAGGCPRTGGIFRRPGTQSSAT